MDNTLLMQSVLVVEEKKIELTSGPLQLFNRFSLETNAIRLVLVSIENSVLTGYSTFSCRVMGVYAIFLSMSI